MANVVGRYKSGRISMAVVHGEYDGKPTVSYTIRKSVKDKVTGQWKDSPFLSMTDLRDLGCLIDKAVQENIKYEPMVKGKSGEHIGSTAEKVFSEGEEVPF